MTTLFFLPPFFQVAGIQKLAAHGCLCVCVLRELKEFWKLKEGFFFPDPVMFLCLLLCVEPGRRCYYVRGSNMVVTSFTTYLKSTFGSSAALWVAVQRLFLTNALFPHVHFQEILLNTKGAASSFCWTKRKTKKWVRWGKYLTSKNDSKRAACQVDARTSTLI